MAKISLPVISGGNKAPSTPEPAAAAASTDHKTRAEGGTVMDEIAHEVAANKVVLYMKGSPQMPQCGFSAKASSILASYNLPFHTVDILADPEKRSAIKEFSDWPTIPQVYVGGEFLGGSDILTQMHQNGELEETINAIR